ncbi:MAG: hypothetical protein DLM71_00110 [Chloroflexi bacterium]|nr:MAG: hypothetical protein DLM71_00110 [Chloroflexota bacterium]
MVPLHGARAKVVRAKEHLRSLEERVADFVESDPYRVVRDLDPQTGAHRRYAVIERQPPPELPLIIGDAVHNLRSALDHAIFEIATRAAAGRLTHRQEERLFFPIFSNRAKYANSLPVKHTMELLPLEVQEYVERRQPYNVDARRRRARLNDPLCVLQSMWNTDKHRTLLLTAAIARLPFSEELREAPEGSFRFTGAVVDNGSEVLHVLPGYDPEEYFKAHFAAQVSFTVGGPVRQPIATRTAVDRYLDGVARAVEWEVGQLERLCP